MSVHRGDRAGIVGPNGAGKSTILGMMEGVITPDEGEVSIEKRIRVGVLRQELIQGNDGPILQEVMNVSDKVQQIRERLKVLEKEMSRLTEHSEDGDEIVEEHGRLLHELEGYGGYTLEARALKVLGGLGFKQEDANRRWSEFSGGWRMRVALAKILLAEPDALLLDEPTNHLDLESLLWVETYLMGFKGALVLVSHDRAFLNRLVNRIIEVDRGKVSIYSGNYDQYETTRQMQEDVLVAAYKNQQEKIKRIQKFIDQNRVKARTASRAQSRVKMLEKIDKVDPPGRAKTLKFTFPQPQQAGRRVLEISGLLKTYGTKTVYEDFSINVDRGDRIGLVGPNGAGKSTLMKIMAGTIPYDGGIVKYGYNVKPGYFAQHQSESLNSDRSVLEEAYSGIPGITEQEVRNLLGAFLFSGDDVYKKVKVLSGGEKSRLALTRILLSPPNFLLMDEPTNHLDIPSCEILEEGLKKYSGTLILITHDRRLMNSICTGILEIEAGSAEYYIGNYEDYQYKKRLSEEQEQNTPVVEPAPVEREDPDNQKESRKERKRREAQNRIALFKKQGPIKQEIQRIEKLLGTKEARKKEIESLMADPSIYDKRDAILPLLEEDPVLSKEIRALESRWEELHTQLEEIERATLTA
ncbi:MAG: ABC-F family ATP-binding cassette domain-containing protein [Desulfomonile tiedjei]|uniref:Probable ATP-binding protein YbiT n=1 Tax=Desulfomonile tiedjei TaxID=2358 RepID=A0A9D6V288_9BACT|nr:ABC-F family ATP-binding cassette domain-containing protein [Desulfomonile tiedjei]